ncbi:MULTISPECIES: YhgE/Pip domain-containing protein [Bacillus]|uniref:YhgE/Pip domain-containing protein n=1 Tax=Bacillus TaxID=1386 RepID=UPI000279700C|nr:MULTISPECIES: YhgE/Pip domain-containing protein [Bacillus]AXR15650.1 YhgE/Pip domain-containing protein [Bacillus sp. CR71]AXR21384.1 YhgE/Pip domain-containing protein [Bacillus sp. E25]EJR03428.1 YhgE/Pip domain-containing protein [Bacillus cereus MSX-A1]MCC2543615.1 YhgE/Pip domain-containing protein [Bacillus thuringiensis]MDF9543924.1 YhgE/Pip domain-containing protein [Bacillus cereus]
MKWNQLLRKEFTEIIKSKKILIPIIAVLFVPILYAGMFLWAFWDPYKQLDDLPVAVVNLDKGAVFDGKPIEVGKGLVDNLKDNTSFKWEFVSEKEAEKGMEGRKYYMLVRIPDDFSSNATTLLKDDPKPLNLEYIPNESLNFLSSQIGGTAIEKIKGEVSSTLTKTYAEKMFDSIQDVSKGLADGAEGANKLHDGSSELHDGSSKVTDGLHTLQGKSGEMKDGAQKLADGSNKLVDGSGKVTNGLNTLNSKTGEMQTGIGKLQDGSQKVTAGLNTLVNKSGELKTGTNELAAGMEQLVGGQSQLEGVSQKIEKGLQELDSKVKSSAAGLEEMQAKVPTILNKVNEKIDGAEKNVNQLNGFTQSTAGDAKNAAQDVANLQKQIESLPKEYQEQLQPYITNAAKSTATVQQKVAVVSGGTKTLNEEVNQLKGEINQKASEMQNKLPNSGGINTLTDGITKLMNAQNQFVSKFHGFGEGLNNAKVGVNKLNKGSDQLIDGVTQLADGSSKVTGGLGTLSAGANQMSGGITQLTDGSSQVTTGLGTLNGGLNQMSTGSTQLIDGVNKLADGSGKVTDGLVKVNDGSGELAEKLGEGAEKTGEVKGTDKTYDMFASPVKVKTEKMAEVPNYGTGFTPYFLSLGLFVGALLLSIVYPLRDTVGVPKSGFSWFISKFGVLLSVGIIQAIVADVILLFGLGVEVQSIPYFILFSIVTSLAFIALIQCLVTAFGDAGRFIAIITLIIQLTTSAGTFPLELIPKFLQPFNAWLPMTYSVSGLKAVVSSGDFNFMWQNIGMLMIFIVVLSLGTIASLTLMHKRQFKNVAENQSVEA